MQLDAHARLADLLTATKLREDDHTVQNSHWQKVIDDLSEVWKCNDSLCELQFYGLQTLSSSDSASILYIEGVRRLRRLCRDTQLVPTSCKLPADLDSVSPRPVSRSNFSDIYVGRLSGRDVAIKVLRLHMDEVENIKKVSSTILRIHSRR
jgi:hypothetical protein